MARFGMVIDTRKCVGCMDCVLACKTENNVPVGYNRDWIVTGAKGKYPDIHFGDTDTKMQSLRYYSLRILLPYRCKSYT